MLEDQMLYQVGKLYYECRRTQLEISRELKTSRSTVSRLLQRAVDQEIVVIKIRYPWRRNAELEQKLAERYNLLEVRVLEADEKAEERNRAGIGLLTARLIHQYVKDGDVVAVSYGRMAASVAKALTPGRQVKITVVPVIGSPGAGSSLVHGPELLRQFAEAYQGEYHYTAFPLLAKDEKTRDRLLRMPRVSNVLEMARHADLVVTGIGDLAEPSPIWNGCLDRRGFEWVASRGAVGHIGGQFFDEDGHALQISTNQRSLGIGLSRLRSLDRVIGVASGKQKAAAIQGALRGRLVNMLVTDSSAAQALLRLEGEQTRQLLTRRHIA